ncbi:TIGR04255 family protein [Achromobacter xylosoxidans]
MHYENSPLIELIADVRWGGGELLQPLRDPIAAMQFQALQSEHEERFMRFGNRVASEGYSRVERVVPPGAPVPAHQAVYRYRHQDIQNPSLYQLGPQVFTANITQPYQSWDSFKPVVAKGLDLFLQTAPQVAGMRGVVTLQYIDAFGHGLTAGKSAYEFLQELGFGVQVPPVFGKKMSAPRSTRMNAAYVFPIAVNTQANIRVGDGLVQSGPVVMLDTAIHTSDVGLRNVDDIMRVLDAAHDIIHAAFVEMAKPLEPLMRRKD